MKQDLVGESFHRLTVIKKAKCPYPAISSAKRNFWLCQCICGKEVIVQTSALRAGKTKSCGCLKAELSSQRGLALPSQAGFNKLLQRYKRQAKKRKLIFSLTDEEFRSITSSKCYYCNADPVMESDLKGVKGISKERITFGRYLYNGIDRVDSSIGYTIQNTVPCCRKCNTWKSDMTQQEFAEHVRNIYEHMNGTHP